jgi:hypothetical protein
VGRISSIWSKPLKPNPNAKGYFLGIGLNRVNPEAYGGWAGELVACHNDVQCLRNAITLGRRWQSPMVLFDAAATAKAVEIAYRQLAFQAQPGDLVVRVQSAHGGQFKDSNKDEADGLDETMCLYDGQVPDDVHASWLAYFKAGVRVVLITDTCHSQTIARGAQVEKAITECVPMLRPKTVPVFHKDYPNENFRDVVSDLQEGKIRGLRAATNTAPIVASVVSLAACKDSQTAMDGDRNGQFTAGLLSVWGEASSYSDLIHRARRYCPDQTPQIELIGPQKHVDAFAKQKPFTL